MLWVHFEVRVAYPPTRPEDSGNSQYILLKEFLPVLVDYLIKRPADGKIHLPVRHAARQNTYVLEAECGRLHATLTMTAEFDTRDADPITPGVGLFNLHLHPFDPVIETENRQGDFASNLFD